MKKIILILTVAIFLGFTISAVQEPLIYYKLNLDYSYGDISINSTEIEFSNEEIENFFGLYILEIIDYNNEILDLIFFDVPNEIIYETVNEEGEISGGGIIELNETSFELFVPYYENAKGIIISDENLNELLKEDISEFSKQQPQLTKEPSEEKIKPKGAIPGIQDISNSLTKYWWVLLILLGGLVIFLLYSIHKKK